MRSVKFCIAKRTVYEVDCRDKLEQVVDCIPGSLRSPGLRFDVCEK
jgi:hypothetical protein